MILSVAINAGLTAGFADRFRVRQGQYRIVYLVDDAAREVTVFKVGHRKEVYR
jgi:mRNA interferase RelE/StbE